MTDLFIPPTENPLIKAPGAYPDIPGDAYHGAEICPEPSISSSGLKLIEDRSAFHYWQQSPLNPNRRPRESRPAFAIGHLLHDVLLYGGAIPSDYHVVPDGFVRAHSNKWADELEAYDAAVAEGKNILHQNEFDMVRAMAESCDRHELATALLTAGEPEITLACQDPKTGRWTRARPDILPTAMEIIPDVKSAVSGHPDDFERQATSLGYFQSAAHYLDVLDILFGEAKRQFVCIVIEKGPANEKHYPGKTYPVTIYHLDDGDIQNGRMLNRRALDLFDRCLRTGEWPAYSSPERPILPLLMTGWARKQIERRVEAGELSWEM
ncbi:MAG TPA: PD-(D/E)XK nuclease-like domain-containing protein [Allosphingosinicella sp.]|nr:PD-(D/E)XK nuclease-like domain-containing protein [Allosphingosinicella sp.]